MKNATSFATVEFQVTHIANIQLQKSNWIIKDPLYDVPGI